MQRILMTGLTGFLLSLTSVAWAAETYRLQVDGLACPFCAYGVEKKLNQVEGVESIDIRINEGLVLVTAGDDAQFDQARAEQIMKEAGFTLSGFEKVAPAE